MALNQKVDPPPELALAWACQRWHSLPDSGAYRDQSATTMRRMNAYLNVYEAYRGFMQLGLIELQKVDFEAYKIYAEVEMMRRNE